MNQILRSNFFIENRANLSKMIGDGPPIVMIAHGLMQRSNDTEYCFEQDRNFFYLSGLNEPDWIMVIDGEEEYLIEPEISDVEKIFNGSPDIEGIIQDSGIKSIISSQEGWEKLSKLKEIRTSVPMDEKVGSTYSNPSKRLFLAKLSAKTTDITAEILHQRTIKQEPEIAAIRRAIDITGEGFKAAKEVLANDVTEADIEAVFSSCFIKSGVRHGYEPIVAGGKNACTLHYTANDQMLPENGLVLVDIGAQYDYYSADVTRTLSLGQPTNRQAEVKEVVRTAFDKIFETIKPGITLVDYQKTTNGVMREAVSSLKLGSSQKVVAKYFPHAPSHGLGLDVHDAMVGYDSFQPGMVVTLEPGIYIPEEDIGVRYEDDLLITDKGVENLSKNIEE